MATIQKRPGRLRRFFGWFGRHKVTAALTVLILAAALYLLGSWVVLRVQIRDERARFMAASNQLESVSQRLVRLYGAESHVNQDRCSYTSTEFGLGHRTCDANRYLIYRVEDPVAASALKAKIVGLGIDGNMAHLDQLATSNEKNLGSYDFKLESMDCAEDYWYFENTTLPFYIQGIGQSPDKGLLVELSCTGSAKADYFPVTK